MFKKEVYFNNLKSQFKDDLKMVLAQWHGHGAQERLDNHTLGEMISSLYRFAMRGGLSEDEWLDILQDMATEKVDKSMFTKIAA